MIKVIKRFMLFIFIGLLISATIAAANNIMSIQVKKGYLCSIPSFLGKIEAELD